MRYCLGVLLACATSVGAAHAADFGGAPAYDGSLKDGPALMSQPSWTGFYVGGHVGYGWADNDVLTIARDDEGDIIVHQVFGPLVAPNSYDSDGWLGGLQLGYNLQTGSWVLGIEADYSWSDISGSFNYAPTVGPQKIAGGDIEWLATVRGRVGYSFDRVLVYGTGGLAIAEMSGFANNFWNDVNPNDRATASSTETGWTIGGGLEVALSQNLSVKGEYLYMRFDDASGKMKSPAVPPGFILDAENDVEIHTVRLGVNYKFGN